MLKLKHGYCFLILVLLELNSFGQERDQKLIEISIGGGISLPIGKYQNQNPSIAAIKDKNVSFSRIVGISKEKNGFASTGYNYNLSFRYNISHSIALSFLATKFVNPVKVNTISDYLVSIDNLAQRMEAPNYSVICFAPGIGFRKSIRKFNVLYGLNAGYSLARYPYYEIILDYMMLNPSPIFAHDGLTPKLHSFVFGSTLSTDLKVSRKLKIGTEFNYLNTSFNYDMSTRLIPGGSQTFEFSDKLNVEVINIAVRLTYIIQD